MNKFFVILSIFGLSLLLTSCGGTNTNPNFDKNDKLNDLSIVEKVNIDMTDVNMLLQSEIEDRKKGYEELNSNREYLSAIKLKLESELLEKYNYINITRQLMLVDLKIIKSVTDGFMKETSISDKNYFYSYLRTLNNDEKRLFISNINNTINHLEKQNDFNKYYYINLDKTKSNILDNNSKDIFVYVNYYLDKVSYKDNYIKSIEDIINYMDILKIDTFEFSNREIRFTGVSKIFIDKENIKNILNILKK